MSEEVVEYLGKTLNYISDLGQILDSGKLGRKNVIAYLDVAFARTFTSIIDVKARIHKLQSTIEELQDRLEKQSYEAGVQQCNLEDEIAQIKQTLTPTEPRTIGNPAEGRTDQVMTSEIMNEQLKDSMKGKG